MKIAALWRLVFLNENYRELIRQLSKIFLKKNRKKLTVIFLKLTVIFVLKKTPNVVRRLKINVLRCRAVDV